jgi:ABC-type molybdate transport system substrate-binding protein
MVMDLKRWTKRWLAAPLLGLTLVSSAADLMVYSAGASKAALGLVVQDFQRDSGHRLKVEYAPVGTCCACWSTASPMSFC